MSDAHSSHQNATQCSGPEKYNFSFVEKKWQHYWAQNHVFAADKHSARPPFYVLEMFPYPSGTLHMGHARNYAIGDALARFRWAKGYEVLHPMGWDACGLPAENAALQHGIHPKTWTYKNAEAMKKQCLSLGFSHDWSREIFSCDPAYFRHEQKMFLDFYKNGLAYRKESYVNWDPKEQSVLANEQVVEGRGWRSGAVVEKLLLKQWFLKITDFAQELLEDLEGLSQWPEAVRDMQKHWIGRSQGLILGFKRVSTEKTMGEEPHGTGGQNHGEGVEKAPRARQDHGEGTVKASEEGKDFLKIFTTRPETLFGASFCAISWDHPWIRDVLPAYEGAVQELVASCQQRGTASGILEKEAQRGALTGLFVHHPLRTGEILPVVVANYVSGDYGTGAIFGCPAHDARDYALALALELPLRSVIRPTNDGEEPSPRHGQSLGSSKEVREQGQRERRVQEEGWEPGREGAQKFPGDERVSDTVTLRDKTAAPSRESEGLYTGDGILINSDFLDGLGLEEGRRVIIAHCVEKNLGKAETLFRLRDWGVGRQRYWGVPIPVIYCPSCGTVPVPEDQLPVVLPEDVHFDRPGNPLQHHPTWKHVPCPSCGSPAQRETDTFDTFFESSWYFARFCDPHNEEGAFSADLAQHWLPVHQYVGGIEHAVMHLLYARFFTKALKKCGYWNLSEPFQGLFTQGMVCHKTYQASDGTWLFPEEVDGDLRRCDGSPVRVGRSEKMSKSKCNVVGVTQMVDTYGADAVRLFVLSDTPPQRDLEWSEEGIEGAWRYVRRLWSLFQEHATKRDLKAFDGEKVPAFPSTSALALRRATHKYLEALEGAMEGYGLNKYAALLREWSNTLGGVFKEGGEFFLGQNGEDTWTLGESWRYFIQALAPLMPHLAEEMGSALGLSPGIHRMPWPVVDRSFLEKDQVIMAVQINGKHRGNLSFDQGATEEEMLEAVRRDEGLQKYTQGPWKRTIVVPGRAISIVI